MIDVNKVFNTKRRKVIDNKVTADRLLTASYPSDDDSDDENNDDNEEVVSDETFARYSYKTGNTFEESETKSTTRVVEKNHEPPKTKINQQLNFMMDIGLLLLFNNYQK